MIDIKLQRQYNLIYRTFKNSTPAFDDLEWDGENLYVVLKGMTIETYTHADLCEIIYGFSDL